MIYADNAATTKMSPVALAAMLPALEDNYGNPSSLHGVGQHAAELLQSAREAMARCLNCKPREILFTSGGSEADNQALLSAAELGRLKGKKHRWRPGSRRRSEEFPGWNRSDSRWIGHSSPDSFPLYRQGQSR